MKDATTLLGRPLQELVLGREHFDQLSWPAIDAGVPSELLSRRPDIARAEARPHCGQSVASGAAPIANMRSNSPSTSQRNS